MPTADRYVTVCARSRSIGSAFRRASQSRDAGQIYRLLRIEHVSVRPAARSVDGVRSSGAARSSQMAANNGALKAAGTNRTMTSSPMAMLGWEQKR